MGKFNVCIRVALGDKPSYAWIALHRCVEANARLTGETFTSIFKRLEDRYKFKREVSSKWPSIKQINDCAIQLKLERTNWLTEMNELIEERKREKKRGARSNTNRRLAEMARCQREYNPPHVGIWGWKRMRGKIA